MARLQINEAIIADELRVRDEHGNDLGFLSRADALSLAHTRGCDLVQEDAASSPPWCRFVTAGAGSRVEHASRPPKEIRVSTAMAAHDLDVRRRQAAALLSKGHGVKVSVRLGKAERSNPVAARALLEQLAVDMATEGRLIRKPFGESGALVALFEPR